MSDRIYLAGPITGCTHAETIGWRQKFAALLAGTSIQCFSPMRGKDHLKLLDKIEGSYPDNILSRSRAIMTRDHFDCSRATLVVANLLKEYMPENGAASLGTVMEIGWCFAYRVPLIAIIDEEKSPYDHPMINEAIGFKVTTLEQAAETAKMILYPV
jgi:nucleoside 2-deoxyribosyltransferase